MPDETPQRVTRLPDTPREGWTEHPTDATPQAVLDLQDHLAREVRSSQALLTQVQALEARFVQDQRTIEKLEVRLAAQMRATEQVAGVVVVLERDRALLAGRLLDLAATLEGEHGRSRSREVDLMREAADALYPGAVR